MHDIKQEGWLQDYQVEFERLNNTVRDWPQSALIGAFVGGLREEIKIEV